MVSARLHGLESGILEDDYLEKNHLKIIKLVV
jgi:hypothetical protein